VEPPADLVLRGWPQSRSESRLPMVRQSSSPASTRARPRMILRVTIEQGFGQAQTINRKQSGALARPGRAESQHHY